MKKNNILKLISPIAPTTNHYLNYRVMRKSGKNIVMPYPSKETVTFKKSFIPYVKEEVGKQNWEMDQTGLQHYYVYWTVYFPRIDMDVSNQDKVIIDSITESEVVWKDDNVVCNRVDHIYYDSSNPRIELTIVPVDYIGVFENEEHLNSFQEKCKECKRYSNNCSILRKLIEGRIIEEYQNNECIKFKKKK